MDDNATFGKRHSLGGLRAAALPACIGTASAAAAAESPRVRDFAAGIPDGGRLQGGAVPVVSLDPPPESDHSGEVNAMETGGACTAKTLRQTREPPRNGNGAADASAH